MMVRGRAVLHHVEAAKLLRQILLRHVAALRSDEFPPEIDFRAVQKLPGLSQTLATGAGLDWITREEATARFVDRRFLGTLAEHRSWRPYKGKAGYWLMAPGFRDRFGLPTMLRPVVFQGQEEECLRLIKLRFPAARLLDAVSIKVCGFNPDLGEENACALAEYQEEQFVAVDHASIHWGSVFDLDLVLRQRGSALGTVFPSTFATPLTSFQVLAQASIGGLLG